MTSAGSTRLPGTVAPITPAASTSQTSRTLAGCCVTMVARRFMTSPLGGGLTSSREHAAPGRAELLGGLGDSRRERGLGLAAPRARVVLGLAADAPVDAKHAVVVGEDVVRDGAGERVLRVRVDVDLDHAVADRSAHFVGARAAAAVEDVVEARAGMGGAQRGLPLAQDLRPQPHAAGRVDAMHVAEGRGEQVAAALAGAEHVSDTQQLRRCRVVARDWAAHGVLLSSDRAGLDLEQDA